MYCPESTTCIAHCLYYIGVNCLYCSGATACTIPKSLFLLPTACTALEPLHVLPRNHCRYCPKATFCTAHFLYSPGNTTCIAPNPLHVLPRIHCMYCPKATVGTTPQPHHVLPRSHSLDLEFELPIHCICCPVTKPLFVLPLRVM